MSDAVVLSWIEEKRLLSDDSFIFENLLLEEKLEQGDYGNFLAVFLLVAAALAFYLKLNGFPYLAAGLYGFLIPLFGFATLGFLLFGADILIRAFFVAVSIILLPLEALLIYWAFFIFPDKLGDLFASLFFSNLALLFAYAGMKELYLLPVTSTAYIRTIIRDIDRQAHLFFVASMAALGFALWLQSGWDWRSMAALNEPIAIPGFFTIPDTAIVSFPFALLGLIENPVGSALSAGAHSSLNQVFLLFAASLGFFFLATARLKYSPFVPGPTLVWAALALCAAAVCVDVSFHWYGAGYIPPALVLFDRAVAVLAGGVYLFWRSKGKNGVPVPGANAEFPTAFKAADMSAWKIFAWLLGFVVVATQASIALKGALPQWSITVGVMVFMMFPFRYMVNFKVEFDEALSRYNELLGLHRASYTPPATVATDEQVRDALLGGRRVGGLGPDGNPWNDPGD